MSIKSENKAGALKSIHAEGLSLAKNRIRYVPLLAQTINPDTSESGNTLSLPVTGRRSHFAFDGEYMWSPVQNTSICMVKYDLRTGLQVATVPTAHTRPSYSMTFDGKYMWANNETGTFSVYKVGIDSMVIEAEINTGTRPFGHAFDGKHLWVGCVNTGDIIKIDVSTNAIVNTINVGTNPSGLAFDGKYIWVANTNGDGSVSKIDPATDSVVAVFRGSDNGTIVSFVFDGVNMWAGMVAPFLDKFDIANNSLVTSVPTTNDTIGSPFIQANTMAFDGEYVWAASANNTITRVDPIANVEVDFLTLSGDNTQRPYGLGFDGTHIWVGNFVGIALALYSRVLARRD
jgi:YVTN family beta-propeller protein